MDGDRIGEGFNKKVSEFTTEESCGASTSNEGVSTPKEIFKAKKELSYSAPPHPRKG